MVDDGETVSLLNPAAKFVVGRSEVCLSDRVFGSLKRYLN